LYSKTVDKSSKYSEIKITEPFLFEYSKTKASLGNVNTPDNCHTAFTESVR
jgi:hypothetical protein